MSQEQQNNDLHVAYFERDDVSDTDEGRRYHEHMRNTLANRIGQYVINSAYPVLVGPVSAAKTETDLIPGFRAGTPGYQYHLRCPVKAVDRRSYEEFWMPQMWFPRHLSFWERLVYLFTGDRPL